MALSGCNGLVGGSPIIGAVRRDRGNGPLDVSEQKRHLCCVIGTPLGQHVSGDLTAAGVNGEMQLAPVPSGSTVLGRIPFALDGLDAECRGEMRLTGAGAPMSKTLSARSVNSPDAAGRRRAGAVWLGRAAWLLTNAVQTLTGVLLLLSATVFLLLLCNDRAVLGPW